MRPPDDDPVVDWVNSQPDDVEWSKRLAEEAERSKRDRIRRQALEHPERMRNNPEARPCGHFTGRCAKCGSSNLWDDNEHYGCNACGAFLN